MPTHLIGRGGAWVVVCVALAVLSWATLPTIPSYDPYAWIIWGREVSDPHLAFAVFDGPSWKPLPFAFTVIYGLFSGAAPTLWMITARAAGLLGLVAAWRLGALLARGAHGGRPAAAAAGLLAAAGIVLTYDWPYDWLRGTSEPGLVAGTLWAVWCLLDGRRRSAFWLGVAVALLRPESWPLLLGSAVWLGVRDPAFGGLRGRLELGGGLALVPLGWFGPPWLGSGTPLLAAHNAALYDGVLGAHPLGTELRRIVGEQTWPLLVAALALVVVGVARDRDRLRLLGLASGVVVWWAIVVVMALGLGYPGLERFFLPAAAVVCVLGGAGIVVLAGELARFAVARRRSAAGPAGRGGLAAAICGVLVAAAAAGSLRPIGVLHEFEPEAALAVRTVGGLDAAVRAAGGRAAVLPCPRSFVAVNHAAQPALAWELRVGLPSVGTAMARPGLDFIGPANRATGIPAAIAPDLLSGRRVASARGWEVYALTRRPRSRPARCIGS